MDNRVNVLRDTPEVARHIELPPLPFIYVRTDDIDQAQYREWRVSPFRYVDKTNEPRSDNELMEMVRRDHESKQWFTSEMWRKKGLPQEQVELQIGDDQITIYNWNKETNFSDEHAQKSLLALQKLSASFPALRGRLRWILIDDQQQASVFGDPEKYPLNGIALKDWNAFRLFPRGTEMFPHRISSTSNFEGTVVHEATHFMQHEFQDDWGKEYKWEFCMDYPGDWDIRSTPDRQDRKWFHKQSDEMSPQGQFPMQPDECVTDYARQNMNEDICESMVAYIYDPDRLKTISSKKFEIIKAHDASETGVEASIKRIPRDQIKLPNIPEEIIHFYIVEPESSTDQHPTIR